MGLSSLLYKMYFRLFRTHNLKLGLNGVNILNNITKMQLHEGQGFVEFLYIVNVMVLGWRS